MACRCDCTRRISKATLEKTCPKANKNIIVVESKGHARWSSGQRITFRHQSINEVYTIFQDFLLEIWCIQSHWKFGKYTMRNVIRWPTSDWRPVAFPTTPYENHKQIIMLDTTHESVFYLKTLCMVRPNSRHHNDGWSCEPPRKYIYLHNTDFLKLFFKFGPFLSSILTGKNFVPYLCCAPKSFPVLSRQQTKGFTYNIIHGSNALIETKLCYVIIFKIPKTCDVLHQYWTSFLIIWN